VSANEAGAIGDTRTVISGEAAYQSANSGFYGQLTCLSTPTTCIAGYPTGSPTFLDASLAAAGAVTKQGYSRTFTVAAAAAGSPTGAVDTFCYQASPAVAGKTGVRSFGGDSSGVIGQSNAAVACCDTTGGLVTATCAALK
jgi:hypothetical protein